MNIDPQRSGKSQKYYLSYTPIFLLSLSLWFHQSRIACFPLCFHLYPLPPFLLLHFRCCHFWFSSSFHSSFSPSPSLPHPLSSSSSSLYSSLSFFLLLCILPPNGRNLIWIKDSLPDYSLLGGHLNLPKLCQATSPAITTCLILLISQSLP